MITRKRTRYQRADSLRVSRSHAGDVPRQASLDALLGLPGWKVLNVTTDADRDVLYKGISEPRSPVIIRASHIGFPDASFGVDPDFDWNNDPQCRGCGNPVRRIKHGVISTTYSDSPSHGRPVIVRAVRQRFKCAHQGCNHTALQPAPNMDERFKMTDRLVSYVRRRYSWWTIQQLADETGLSRRRIGAVVRFHKAETLRSVWLGRVWSIGIDEVQLGKAMWTVIVDNRTGRLLKLIEGKVGNSAIREVLQQLARDHPVTTVTMDMSSAYRAEVRRAFGGVRTYNGRTIKGVKIVADKWHVLRRVDTAFDEAVKALPAQVSTHRIKERIKKFRSIQRIAPRYRSKRQDQFRSMMLDRYPALSSLLNFRFEFYSIYRLESLDEATRRLEGWLFRCADVFPQKILSSKRSLGGWQQEILAWFKGRATNARAEYMNRLLKGIHTSRGRMSVESRAVKALFRNVAPSPDLLQCSTCGAWFDGTRVSYTEYVVYLEKLNDQAPVKVCFCASCESGETLPRTGNDQIVVRGRYFGQMHDLFDGSIAAA